MIEVMAFISLIELALAFVIYSSWAVRFGLRRNWRKSIYSRHLFRLSVIVALITGASLFFRLSDIPILIGLAIENILFLLVDLEGLARHVVLSRADFAREHPRGNKDV